MISHSTVSKPATVRGSAFSVMASVACSLKQGIWMMSFFTSQAWARTGINQLAPLAASANSTGVIAKPIAAKRRR